MTLPFGMNYLDAALLVIFILMGGRGFFRGFLSEVAGLVSLVGGIFLAGRYQSVASGYLAKTFGDAVWLPIAAYALILVAVVIGVGIIVAVLHKLMVFVCADFLNHLLGLAAGLFKGLLLACVLVYGLRILIPQSDLVRESVLRPYVEKVIEAAKEYFPSDKLKKAMPKGTSGILHMPQHAELPGIVY